MPAVGRAVQPRMSVCLFYASAEEVSNGSVSVLSNGSFCWTHPDDESKEYHGAVEHERKGTDGEKGSRRWLRPRT